MLFLATTKQTDYPDFTLPPNAVKPLGVLIACQADTSFITSDAVYSLNAGDILTFHGDIIHAGASYETSNTRIHIYLDTNEVVRINNKIWVIVNDEDVGA